MAKLSLHVHERLGGSVFLVPHQVHPSYYGPDDRSAAEALVLRLGRPHWMHSIQGDYSPPCLKGFIGQCDVLVASRMHAAIAGLSSGVPTLLVAWSHKYRGVMEEIGLDGCVWDQDDRASVPLTRLFDQLWARREPVRARLLEYTARAKKEIAAMAQHIATCIPRPSPGAPMRPARPTGSQAP
jgi:polysaccharide pyruvyl transferase WcaK-like protein